MQDLVLTPLNWTVTGQESLDVDNRYQSYHLAELFSNSDGGCASSAAGGLRGNYSFWSTSIRVGGKAVVAQQFADAIDYIELFLDHSITRFTQPAPQCGIGQ